MTATGLYDARHGNRSTALIYILTTGRVPSYPVGYPGNELPDYGSPSDDDVDADDTTVLTNLLTQLRILCIVCMDVHCSHSCNIEK